MELREQLPDSKAVRPRLAALAGRNRRRRYDRATALRLRLLDEYRARIVKLDADEKAVCRELSGLVRASGSTLDQLCGLSTRSVAELLIEVGDPRRFTEGGFARFNASAPLAASTAEGPGEPVRHRYNPGGNRRINRILDVMAITQLRCEPRAQAIYSNARANGHTKKEARRILKRHLSDGIYRRMIGDRAAHAQPSSPHDPARPPRSQRVGRQDRRSQAAQRHLLTAIGGPAPPSRKEGLDIEASSCRCLDRRRERASQCLPPVVEGLSWTSPSRRW